MNKAVLDSLIQSRSSKDPELTEVLKQIAEDVKVLQDTIVVMNKINNNSYFTGKAKNGRDDKRLIGVDDKNHINIGSSSNALGTGEFHLYIPCVASSALPAASDELNGLTVCDVTNSRFCFYINGSRYFLTKTAF